MNDKKPDGSLNNRRIHVTPETKDAIEALVRERGYEYDRFKPLDQKEWWLIEQKGHFYVCDIAFPESLHWSAEWARESTPIYYDPETNSLVEEDSMERNLKNMKLEVAYAKVDEEPKEDTCPKYNGYHAQRKADYPDEKFCSHCGKPLEKD